MKLHAEKWRKIISAFRNNEIDRLRSIQRTGSRGRIFHVLVEDMLKLLQLGYQPEPIFDHIEIQLWYADFASRHNLKIRTHDFYNPDFLLDDGTWLEVSLSENTAYKKLFRYGHQAPRLTVIWLDEDDGLHKRVCENVSFPNAEVKNVKSYYSRLKCAGCNELIEEFDRLKELKGTIL